MCPQSESNLHFLYEISFKKCFDKWQLSVVNMALSICVLMYSSSHVVGPRHPLRKDPDLDYDIDSDEEWEEVLLF